MARQTTVESARSFPWTSAKRFCWEAKDPTPLFFLAAMPTLFSYAVLGSVLHAQKTPELFVSLHRAVANLSPREKPIGSAYARGFICHYALDSTMHPFVYAQQYALCDAGIDGLTREDGRDVHALIESSFDEMILFVKTGETIATYHPWERILGASDEVLSIISKLYQSMATAIWGKSIPRDLFTRAVKGYRRMQRMLYSPQDGKRALIASIEKLVRHHSFYNAMSHRVVEATSSPFGNHDHHAWKNPFTGAVRTDDFWDLYQGAQELARKFIAAFDKPDFSLEQARDLTQGINFSGRNLRQLSDEAS